MKQYFTGGYVRDKLLGVESKDIDIAVVGESYEEMRDYILGNRIEIYQERPEFNTIRGLDLALGPVDYVFCYDLHHDLCRRDFTINAMAIDRTNQGEIIDLHGGQKDLKNKIIRGVIDPDTVFKSDPLRMIRAIRFIIKYNFVIENLTEQSMRRNGYLLSNVSEERLRQELEKIFKLSTIDAIEFLRQYSLYQFIFCEGKEIWLMPTLGKK